MVSGKGIAITAIFTTIGLIGGNFAYQALFTQNWAQAAERSFFQFWAIGTLVILLHMIPGLKIYWNDSSYSYSSSSSQQQ